MDIEDYIRLGLDKSHFDDPDKALEMVINGRSNAEHFQADMSADNQYNPCAEAYPADDVPRGTVTEYLGLQQSRVYEGAVHDVWIYRPAQLEPGMNPSVMVFQDGKFYLDPTGQIRPTAVLDTMIHAGELPPTVAVFVMPTNFPEAKSSFPQRYLEYDYVTDTYVRFLVNDLLPFAEAETGVQFSQDPTKRTICGLSSGGICAFNAAWHDPSAFGRVLSHCGSFVNLRGGHEYPYLVRTTPRKPIRVLLQSGENDLYSLTGNWPLANKMMADALEYAGYESRFVFGKGGHSLRHGGAIFADSLRWLAS